MPTMTHVIGLVRRARVSPPTAVTAVQIAGARTTPIAVASPPMIGMKMSVLEMKSANPEITAVMKGLMAVNASARTPVIAADRLPTAPSIVETDFAASTAMGSLPIVEIAALNSSALICPSLIAVLKSPVNAPASSSAFLIATDDPPTASVIWFQSSAFRTPVPLI